MHGYDVVDHASVSSDLGGDEAWERFSDEARRVGLGVVVDVVPNHLSLEGGHNQRWLDVLEHGASSSSAEWFELDWVGRAVYQQGIEELPVLGALYRELIPAGGLAVSPHGATL